DLDTRDRVVGRIRQATEPPARHRGVSIQIELLNADPPARADESVLAAITTACGQLCLSSKRMISRAYHDALFMSRLCPTGMIFIPCKDGISHRPDEYSSPEAIRRGVEVLALTLAGLAGGSSSLVRRRATVWR